METIGGVLYRQSECALHTSKLCFYLFVSMFSFKVSASVITITKSRVSAPLRNGKQATHTTH